MKSISKELFPGVFFLFQLVTFLSSAPFLKKDVPNQFIEREGEWDYTLPLDLFGNLDNSTIYESVSPNNWISTKYISSEIVGVFDFINSYGVAVKGSHCFVADYNFGLRVLDTTDPTYYHIVGGVKTNGRPTGIAMDGDFVIIILDVGRMESYGIFNPLKPVFVGSYDFSEEVVSRDDGCIYLKNGIAFYGHGPYGYEFVDIVSKSNMFLLYSSPYEHVSHIASKGNYAYLVIGPASSIKVLDISVPSIPVTETTVAFSYIYGISIHDTEDYLYVAEGSFLRIYSLTSPDNPSLDQSISIGNPTFSNLLYHNNYVYMAALQQLCIIDVTTPSSPTKITLDTNIWLIKDVESFTFSSTDDDLLFVSQYFEGIKILNVTNYDKTKTFMKASPTPHFGKYVRKISFLDEEERYLVVNTNNRGYSSTSQRSFQIFDITQNTPRVVPHDYYTLYPFDNVKDVVGAKNGYVYITQITSIQILNGTLDEDSSFFSVNSLSEKSYGDNSDYIYVSYDTPSVFYTGGSTPDDGVLSIFQVNDFSVFPEMMSTIDLDDENENMEISVDNDVAYVSLQTSGLFIVNVTDKKNPELIGEVETDSSINGLFVDVERSLLFVAGDIEGMKIVDISDNTSPEVIASFDTSKAQNVFVHQQHAFIADGENGVIVVDVSNPLIPIKVEIIETGNAVNVIVKDNYIYVADGEFGIKVIRMSIDLQLSSSSHFCGKTDIEVIGKDCSGSVTHAFILEREDYCSGHGSCESANEGKCSCVDGFSGEYCDEWSCGEFSFRDYSNTCNGKGACKAPNECECEGFYTGEKCETNTVYTTIVVPGVATVVTFIGLLMLTCLCLIFTCCCFSFIFLCCSLFVAMVVVVRQCFNLKKYGQLKNFDLLLREQEMEDDISIAHIKINKKLFEIDMDDVKSLNILGEGGSNSVVFKALWNGKHVAFKCFKTRTLMSNQNVFNEFEREVEVLASVSHPNIIAFYGACLKPPRVGIVMEFCENGEILVFVMKFKAKTFGNEYPLIQKLRLLAEVVSSLEYVHSKNIIHRDLKCENVLVSKDEKAKLMDFGISRCVESMSIQKTKYIGTSTYMAPELINSGSYDEKCDVFSLGIMMFILLTENPNPYEHLMGSNEMFSVELKVSNDPNFRPRIEDLDDKLDSDGFGWIKDVIVKCWSHRPEERYSCREIRIMLEERGSIENYEKKNLEENRFSMSLFRGSSEEKKMISMNDDEMDLKGVPEKYRVMMERLKTENNSLKKQISKLKK